MKNAPEKRFRAGAVSATVWLNEGKSEKGDSSKWRTISLQRSYKDKEEKWQNTSNMRINDLPRATLVLQRAYEYLVSTESNDEIAM